MRPPVAQTYPPNVCRNTLIFAYALAMAPRYIPARIEMIAMTHSNSVNEKPALGFHLTFTPHSTAVARMCHAAVISPENSTTEVQRANGAF